MLRRAKRSDNLITAIRHTSKDAAWWKKNIIQPTEAEKKIIEAGERKQTDRLSTHKNTDKL